MSIKTKICGLRTKEAVDTSLAYGASYLGFVFYSPSPRNISPEDAAAICKHVPSTVKRVAVTVSMSNSELEALLKAFTPDYLQLHGNESPERVKEVQLQYSIPIIKAISVSSAEDITLAARYEKYTDMLLFDAKPPKDAVLPGGNGVSFDWNLLKDAKMTRPWFLSGGLSCQNIAQALKNSGATMVDVSSGIESSPGVKDIARIKEFLTLSAKSV